MSYCRWSTDAFRCDVYAYEDCHGGWTIHVAGQKRLIPDDVVCPFEQNVEMGDPKWFEYYNEFNRKLDTYPFAPITTESAGKTFNEPTLNDFRERMVALRAEGVRFPAWVLSAIDEEIAELGAS